MGHRPSAGSPRWYMSCRVVLCLLALSCPALDAWADGKLQQADALYDRYRQSDDQAPLKEAATLLDGLQQAEPDNYDVLWRRGRVYYSLGDDAKANSEKLRLFDQAIQSAKHATDVKPGGVEGHYWLGVGDGGYGEAKGMFKALSMTKNIRTEMEAVIRIDPAYENGGAYLVLGRMDFELPGVMGGSKKRAIQEYEDGLRVVPSNPLMKVYLAESYINADRKPEAKNLLDQVLAAPASPATPEMRDAKREARKLYDKNFSGK
jgi:tetratricopeptide (TPR) repeat protein